MCVQVHIKRVQYDNQLIAIGQKKHNYMCPNKVMKLICCNIGERTMFST